MRGFPGAGGTGAPFRGTCPPCSRLDQNVEDMCVKSTGGLLERPAGHVSLAVGGRFFFSRRLGLDQGQSSRRPLTRFVGCVAVLVCARAL